MSGSRVLALVAVVVGLLAGIAHPVGIVAAGALAGSGAVVAALARLRHARAEETALVADWLRAKAYDDETVGDVLARFSDVRIAEIAESHRTYLLEQGREAERCAEHKRRCEAARRGAATRQGRP